jgi:signal peptidase I
MDLRGVKEFLKDTSKYIIIGIIILIIFIYIVSLQQVLGPSMEPNYKEGEIYLLNKINYKLFDVKRFDVVVVDTESSKYMIKRVIGLPGEHLEYKENKLYINGQVIEENFLKNGDTEDYNITSLKENVIPENHYFVIGDNRINSTDSRIFGFVEEKDIVGKVGFRIWPIIK